MTIILKCFDRSEPHPSGLLLGSHISPLRGVSGPRSPAAARKVLGFSLKKGKMQGETVPALVMLQPGSGFAREDLTCSWHFASPPCLCGRAEGGSDLCLTSAFRPI